MQRLRKLGRKSKDRFAKRVKTASLKDKITVCIGRIIFVLIPLSLFLCPSCEGFNNSVPVYPVRMTIDTREGVFVHFKKTAICSYVILNSKGYYYNGEFVKLRPQTDAYGYGGVIVYVNMLSSYDAWDLACPYCAARGRCVPCDVDGIFATCPQCGEQYDLGSGTAVPQKGIGNESLRRLPLDYDELSGKITVNQ